MTATPYVPAAGRSWLTAFYDTGVALTMREPRWRPQLVEAALDELPDGGTVIDIGAGTGAISLALAARRPDANVIAIDGDPSVLDRARAKAGADCVTWTLGDATELPISDATADRVTCSLLLHHLTTASKLAALRDAHRALRPNGRLHIAEWGAPTGPATSAAFALLQRLDGHETTADHRAGRLPELIEEAGFSDATISSRVPTVWGSLELLTAHRSG